jgi:acetoin utilization deacetylase AcuC-like enzyme
MVGFCTSPRFVEHRTGPHHPERADRIRAIFAAVRQAGLVDSPNPLDPDGAFADLSPQRWAGEKLIEIEPVAADEKWLYAVHAPEHVANIKRVCAAGGGVLDLGDTPVGRNSFEIAMLGVGAVLTACDAVMRGERGVRRAFAAVRPPGHHAEPDRPMGFCLFGNVAIAARYVQKQYGVGRVGIVDFDVHHGNGTQAAFENDPSVYFVSLHQNPRTCYPGSGYEWEIGVGAGRGFTMNVPFDPGAGDEEYYAAFDSRVMPALEEFRPEVLLVSAGFDGHRDDPLAQIELSDEAYEQMTRRLVGLAERHCAGRIVSVLEGGYNLGALGRSAVRHLIGLHA